MLGITTLTYIYLLKLPKILPKIKQKRKQTVDSNHSYVATASTADNDAPNMPEEANVPTPAAQPQRKRPKKKMAKRKPGVEKRTGPVARSSPINRDGKVTHFLEAEGLVF